MENTITEEIILQPDGKFYKRKAVTTYLMSQEEAIQKVKAKPIYQVCPIPVNNASVLHTFQVMPVMTHMHFT